MPSSVDTLASAPKSPSFDIIHGNMLAQFSNLVEDLDGDPQAILGMVGLQCANSEQGRPRPTYRQFVTLLEMAAKELDCLDFGLQLAIRQSPSALVSTLGECMRNSRTLGDALKFVSSHSYAHSLAAWIWLNKSASGVKTVIGHDILVEGLPQKTQAMEYILLTGNLTTLALTDWRVRARRVLFRHQPITTMASYRRYFGCDVRFGRNADALVYDDEDLGCTLSGSNAQTHHAAKSALESKFVRQKPPLQADVRGVVFHLLGVEACSRERVAAALSLHPRTMLRRLTNEGTSFVRIKDAVRRDRLLYYAGQTDLNFAAISEKLGFSEQAVMTRACQTWFGSNPTTLRAMLYGEK